MDTTILLINLTKEKESKLPAQFRQGGYLTQA